MRVALLLFTAISSGCLAAEEAPPPAPIAEAPEPTFDWTMDSPDGARVLATLKDFTSLAAQRFDNLFNHQVARMWLETEWTDAGLNVTRQEFSGAGQTVSPVTGQNIIATIPGRSNQTIILGAHYDSAVTSVEAAYDDGTGTMLLVEMGRALATREWNHTIVLVAFDQEEAGLVGSSFHAAQMRDEAVPITVMVNYDMVGINWPAGIGGTVNPIPINFYAGGDAEQEMVGLWQAGMSAAEYPAESSTQTTGLGGGSSDHGPYRNAEYNAAWVRGALIGSYPAYHNVDTVEAMTVVVGGFEQNLIDGFQAVMDLSLAFVEQVDSQLAA